VILIFYGILFVYLFIYSLIADLQQSLAEVSDQSSDYAAVQKKMYQKGKLSLFLCSDYILLPSTKLNFAAAAHSRQRGHGTSDMYDNSNKSAMKSASASVSASHHSSSHNSNSNV
jgi:hypothetical protein